MVKEGETDGFIALYRRKAVAGQNERTWDDSPTAPGNDEIRMRSAKVVTGDGTPIADIDVDTPLQVEFDYWNYVEGAQLNVTLSVKTVDGHCAFITASSLETMPAGLVKARCQIPGRLLNDGTYSIDLIIVRGTTNVVYSHNDILVFEVRDVKRNHSWYGKWAGAVRPRLNWDHYHH